MEKHSSLVSLRKIDKKRLIKAPSSIVTNAQNSTDLKKLSSSISSKLFNAKNNLKSSLKTIKLSKIFSSKNFSGKELIKSSSSALKPFPVVDHEFYQESIPNYFWQKEMNRNNSEKSIMSKSHQNDSTRKNDGNSKIFYNSFVFEKNLKKNYKQRLENSFVKPKNVVIDLYRLRDYHTHTNLFQTEKSLNNEDINKKSTNKAVSPMHLKLYSSTMQNSTNKINLPNTHPSYNKDPSNKQYVPATTKKRLDLMKTSYNFLKNYY